MDEIKKTIAKNLTVLRQTAGLTQAELAEFLCYSDKSVSKWERGESAPDISVLKAIADRFSVTVDYLITPHDDDEPLPAPEDEPESAVNTHRITVVAVLGIFGVSFIVFVILWLAGTLTPLPMAIATPIALITMLVLNSIWEGGKNNFYIVSALMLSIFGLLYLIFLSQNWWQLFLIAIPAELIIFVAFHIKSPRKR